VDDPHKKLTFENAKVQSTTHRGLQRGEKRGKFEVKRKQLQKNMWKVEKKGKVWRMLFYSRVQCQPAY
jgi:hypothetical protein